jgi:NAD(P)-dependent dehydrogenase (short-subunit alcohol dehydrogenase family)
MAANHYGRIVNLTSELGLLHEMEGGYDAYRLSKTAINAVTRIFASQGKGKNVLVNSVDPGWVKTDMGGSYAPRSIEEGVDSIIWAATLDSNGPTGQAFRDRQPVEW